MWKLICALLLFQRALSAPSRCMEICGSQNSQYYSNTNCCSSPLVSSPEDNKNWTDHKDFQTNDGALVHTKDGKFVNGNTRGSFNEMSYYKEWSGGNQNLGNNQNFPMNTGLNQNFGSNYGISQKLEDLSTTQSTFESVFQSRFSDLIKNFRESFRHLQELKSKDQLPTQDCTYPCVPINEQISQLQHDITAQQQYMQRVREDLWSKMQNQNTVTEAEQIIPNQHLSQSNYHPGEITKETNRYESYHNEKITTNPHITTKVTKKPDKYISVSDQTQKSTQDRYGSVSTHESSQNYASGTQGQTVYNQQTYPDQPQKSTQGYYAGSVSKHQSSQNYATGTQGQTVYNQQTYPDQPQKSTQGYYSGSVNKQESSQNYGSGTQVRNQQIHDSQNRVSGYDQQNYSDQNNQNYGHGIQSQVGYTQDTTNYQSQNQGPLRADQHISPQYSQEYGSRAQNQVSHASNSGSQNEKPQTDGKNQNIAYGYHSSYGSQSYYSSLPQSGHNQQNSVYRTHQGYQTDGSQTQRQNSAYATQQAYQTQSGQQNSAYGTHQSYQTDGSQTHNQNSAYGSQKGYQTDGSQTESLNPQSFTLTADAVAHSSITHNYGADFGSRDGKLTHGLIQMGPDCDDAQPAPYRRYKRHLYPSHSGPSHPSSNYHHHHHHRHHYPENDQDNTQETDQQVENFGEPLKTEKISQKDIENLRQEVEDISQGKLETQDDFSQKTHDLPSQSQDFSHHTHLNNDYYHQNSFDDFPSTGNYQQQNHGFDDYSQYNYNPQYTQDYSHRGNNFQDSQKSENFGPIPNYKDQQFPTYLESQSQENGFNQKTVGQLTLDQHARDSFNFNQFQTPVLAPDNHQAENQRFNGINQVNLPPRPAPKPTSRPRNSKPSFKLNIEKNAPTMQNDSNTNDLLFNPEQKIQSSFDKISPKTHEDAENQLLINQVLTPPKYSSQLKPGEEFSQKSQEFSHQFQKVDDKLSEHSQHVMKPNEVVLPKHENPSQVVTPPEEKKRKNLFEILSQDVAKKESFQKHDNLSKDAQFLESGDSLQHVNSFKDFPQQILNPPPESLQKHENPFGHFSEQSPEPKDAFQKNVNPFDHISQQTLKPREESLQKHENSFDNFQQISEPKDSFQQHVNPFESFSQQVLKPREESLQKHENPFENFQQVSEPKDSFQQHVNPFESFPQQVFKPREESFQEHENPFEHFSEQSSEPKDSFQQYVDPFSDFSQVSNPESLQKHENPFEHFPEQSSDPEDSFQQHVNPFEGVFQQVLNPPIESLQKHENPFENFQVSEPKDYYQQHVNPVESFSQQVLNPPENVYQHNVNPFEDLSHHTLSLHEKPFQQHVNPFEDFSQQISKPKESFEKKTPFEDFSQNTRFDKNFLEKSSQKIQIPSLPQKESFKNIENPSEDMKQPRERLSQNVQKPLDDFSQQIQKYLEDSFPKGQKPFEDLSQQINGDFSQLAMTPFENFSSQEQDDSLQKIQKSINNNFEENLNKNLSQEIEKTFQQVSQHIQKFYKDLSKTSDLNKDITQLPQSFQYQDKMKDHSDSDIIQPQEISLGHQWHLFHNPHDLTNEDLRLGKISGSVQEKLDKTEIIKEIKKQKQASNENGKELEIDQEIGQEQLEPWQEEMSREVEVNRGKLEFGQSVQKQRNDPQVQSELPLLSLQPRILEAYGGKGPYDPMHGDDIFSDVRQNPSATLPPVMMDDPWDVREKQIEASDMINEDKVIPLDTVWVYSDAFPITPVTEQPNSGFWSRVGRKFTNAVDKAKDKARDIFG